MVYSDILALKFYADMDDRHSINEDQIAHDKHDRPKSDDIIAKVEELGQRSAPPAATAEQEVQSAWLLW